MDCNGPECKHDGDHHLASRGNLRRRCRVNLICKTAVSRRVTTFLTDDLILLQKRSDTAGARVGEIQERHGRPSIEGGWSREAHAEWTPPGRSGARRPTSSARR